MRSIILFVMMTSPLLGQEGERPCAVTLRVVNAAGLPQPYSVTAFRDDNGVDYADRFQGLRGTVPCRPGLYEYQVKWNDVNAHVANLTRVEGKVPAYKPETWLTVATDPNIYVSPDHTRAGFVNASGPVGYVWKGRITPVPEEPVWIQFRSAIRANSVAAEIESEVDANGEFRAYGPFFQGSYIVYVMNKEGRILYLAPVRSESRSPLDPLEITLPSLPPAETVIR